MCVWQCIIAIEYEWSQYIEYVVNLLLDNADTRALGA